MSVLAEQLLATATSLAASLPPGADLDAALRSGHEHAKLEQLRLAGELRRLADTIGARISGDLDRRDDTDPGAEPVATRYGERSLADVVARAAGLPDAVAQQWCEVGAAVTSRVSLLGHTLPAERPWVGTALDHGGLSLEAAAMITRALRQLEDHTTVEERDWAEGFLVRESSDLTMRQLGRLCTELRDRFDQDGIEPREEDLRAKSGLKVSRTRDGLVRWTIDMDPETAGFATTALDARTAPRRRVRFEDPADPAWDPAVGDTRSLAQKRLEAFAGLMKGSLKADDGVVAGTAVTMVVTIDFEALKTGIGRATIAGVDEPICAKTARRLAAEADLIPMVLGKNSVVLDVGHATRLFTQAQRLALAMRDGGCAWPGCEAPPGWCEAAHNTAWRFGGRTDVSNGALLCPFHHRRLDQDGWELEVRKNIPYFIPPPWVDPARTPRRGGRQRLPDELAPSG